MSPPDNLPRQSVGTDHVESWFIRANHPHEPRALWLKATTLTSAKGTAVAEAWVAAFDGDRTAAVRATIELGDATFRHDGDGLDIEVGSTTWRLDAAGGVVRGELAGAGGRLSWDLRLTRVPGKLGEPLCLLPSRRLLDTKLPRNKLVTPLPVAAVTGTLRWDGEVWELADWHGMQGHNWGAAHAPEYAWGHCVFTDRDGVPFGVVEGVSGRIDLAGYRTPLLSLLTVRRGERELRFDRVLDLWRQRPRIAFPSWTLQIRGRDGKAALAMTAVPSRMVCLGYDQPSGQRHHCLNSKTAAVSLSVQPVDDEAFTCTSACGGALELLQADPEPRVGPPV